MPRILRPTGMRKYRPFSGPGGELESASGGSGGSLAAYEAAVTTADPERWYKMDESSGNLVNQGSDVVSDLTLAGAASATYGETGYFDSSAITPSATSYWWSATAFSYTDDITCMALANRASAPSGLKLIAAQYSSSAGAGGFLFGINASGQVELAIKTTGSGTYRRNYSTASVCDGSWHLITARITSNVVSIFVDGSSVAITQSNPTGTTYNNTSVSVGAQRDYTGTPSLYYDGTMDDTLLWSRGLSDAEILDIAEAAGLA
jgi:hypothetical protein